jgi:hypothetical protein
MFSSTRSAAALALRGMLSFRKSSPLSPQKLIIKPNSQASIALDSLPLNRSYFIFFVEACFSSDTTQCAWKPGDATANECYGQGEARGAIA